MRFRDSQQGERCMRNCNRLHQTATDCSRLQQTATDCNRLQQTAAKWQQGTFRLSAAAVCMRISFAQYITGTYTWSRSLLEDVGLFVQNIGLFWDRSSNRGLYQMFLRDSLQGERCMRGILCKTQTHLVQASFRRCSFRGCRALFTEYRPLLGYSKEKDPREDSLAKRKCIWCRPL